MARKSPNKPQSNNPTAFVPADSMAARYPDESPVNKPQISEAAKLARAENRQKFITLADQVAEHTHYLMNWKWPGANAHVPDSVSIDFKFVDKYYPLAKGGPLLVDEPSNDPKIVELCYEKQRVLKKLGFRHIVIEEDASLYELMEQLDQT